MEIKLGDILKRLRKDKSITQETLAQALNISPQSVSKWERGESYPDISLLPAIANYFNISVDALLGNDKNVIEQKIEKYLSECLTRSAHDDINMRRAALEIAKTAYEEFPYDYRIIMLYVNMLNIYGKEEDRELMLRLCGTVSDCCTDEKLVIDARSHIRGLLSAKDRMAFLEKYIEYGQNWDWFKVYPFSTDEGKILMQHEIADKWWHLNAYIGTYYSDFNPNSSAFSHEDRIRLIQKQQKIFYAVFDEDDLGEYSLYVGQHNEMLAREYIALGITEEALECLEKAVNGWLSYYQLPEEYTYRNILLDHRPYIKPKDDAKYGIACLRSELDKEIYDCLRKYPRFDNVIKMLDASADI